MTRIVALALQNGYFRAEGAASVASCPVSVPSLSRLAGSDGTSAHWRLPPAGYEGTIRPASYESDVL